MKVTKKAKKQLKDVKTAYKKEVNSALELIKENPLYGKPLRLELAGKFTYKIGSYRIIYKINEKDKIITILAAGHRSTIYQLNDE